MKFPNKVNRYKTTIIYQMAEVLCSLETNATVTELYRRISGKMDSKSFYEALSSLYAIGKIKMTIDGRIEKC